MSPEALAAVLQDKGTGFGAQMQADDSIHKAAAELENTYRSKANVNVMTVIKDSVVSNVSVVGAAFNAKNESLTLRIEPSTHTAAPGYKSFLSVDIDLLDSDGKPVQEKSGGWLKVPVCITMPVPAGSADPYSLVIYHYYENDASDPECIFPYVFQAADGTWMLRFSVNRFSPFVFSVREGASASAAQPQEPAASAVTVPQTGDAFPHGGAAAVFGVSLAGLGALLLLRKKRR